MRLIDADALIGTIEKYKFGAISSESEREYTREIMLCFVNGSPTAYDTEKVVEQIKEASYQETADDMDAFGDIPRMVLSLKKAVEIVRKGGAE